ncbi:MAG: acyl carrier protein [Colwellia sp.]|nr:acyl carrier protein [Colwellia sp.]
MTQLEIEFELIKCLRENIEECEEEVPELDGSTSVFNGIAGFDSLRALEVLVSLEDAIGCELPPEKVFTKEPTGTDTIADLACAIKKIVNNE